MPSVWPGETSSEKGGREVWHRQWEKSRTYRLHTKQQMSSDHCYRIYITLNHYPLSRVMLGIIARLNLESKTCFFPDLSCFSNLFHGLVLSFKASFFVFCKTTFFHRCFFSKATKFPPSSSSSDDSSSSSSDSGTSALSCVDFGCQVGFHLSKMQIVATAWHDFSGLPTVQPAAETDCILEFLGAIFWWLDINFWAGNTPPMYFFVDWFRERLEACEMIQIGEVRGYGISNCAWTNICPPKMAC